jgi:hypothetical protein
MKVAMKPTKNCLKDVEEGRELRKSNTDEVNLIRVSICMCVDITMKPLYTLIYANKNKF